MSSPRRPSSTRGRTTRGPLPASVYWRRRLFVLALAGSLVFAIGNLLGGGSDAKSDDPVAEQAGARVAAPKASASGAPTMVATVRPGTKTRKGRTPVVPTPTLAAPQGVCDPADVVVTPAVAKGSVAGQDVRIGLSLRTLEAEACTWQVSAKSLIVGISARGKEIWSTRHCPRLVPVQSVVVRRAVPTAVGLTWNARKSAEGCRRATDWVLAGDYTIAAAALGGEPVTAEFALGMPARPTITVTPKPKQTTTKLPRKPRN